VTLNRSGLSNHLWTRVLGETTAASGRSDIFPPRERKDRSRCPRRTRRAAVTALKGGFSRATFAARASPPGADPGDGSTSGMWSARATTAAALGENRLFLPSDAGQADVAPSLFRWVGFLVKLSRSRSADVISLAGVQHCQHCKFWWWRADASVGCRPPI
jgi:hypothetical protein